MNNVVENIPSYIYILITYIYTLVFTNVCRTLCSEDRKDVEGIVNIFISKYAAEIRITYGRARNTNIYNS